MADTLRGFGTADAGYEIRRCAEGYGGGVVGGGCCGAGVRVGW